MKNRIFSGIQPSGNLHLGNYLGAIQNWVKLQNEYDSIFCVVDMHAITVPQDPEKLRKKTLEVAKIYLAAGIDPENCALFIQSHVKEHAELGWILNTISKVGELKRMTQFKDKAGISDTQQMLSKSLEKLEEYHKARTKAEEIFFSKKVEEQIKNREISELEYHKNVIVPTLFEYAKAADAMAKSGQLLSSAFVEDKKAENVSTGLFDYPVLMAADILLYDTQVVPVGEDQKQHVELARDLAKRFNHKFGETFVIPEARVKKEGMRIMGLDDPTKKMSKSAKSEYNYIALSDDAETVRKKIKKAVTDSGSEIVYQDEKPALKNLINIYSLLGDMTPQEIEKEYAGKGYADFKSGLAETIITFLEPFQKRMAQLSDEKVLEILRAGAERVRPIAKKKLEEVKRKIGFIE